MGLEVPPLFDDPEAGKATLFEPMELDKDLPDHVPRNASMARELQAICYRRGWYYGYSGACRVAANPADSRRRCAAVRSFTMPSGCPVAVLPCLQAPTTRECLRQCSSMAVGRGTEGGQPHLRQQ